MPAIEILGITKSYPVGFFRHKRRTALQPLNLTVEEGETFGFLGPNGAGKTTTLKILMGIVFPNSGEARILGHHFHDPEIKKQIGFLPEQPYFYDYLSAPELLDYYAQLSGVAKEQRRKRIPELLARVGLPDVGKMQLRKLSKGMLQRVGIAQAIIHDPKIVFLDEPMSGLDPIGRREIRELILSLKQEGRTVFFSTHILSDAEALCDRVGVIHKGVLRGIGVVEDLKSQHADKSEVVWQGAQALNTVKGMVDQSHVTGETVRAVVQTTNLDALLEKLRRERARLVSVAPLHGTLEDYFVAHTSEKETIQR